MQQNARKTVWRIVFIAALCIGCLGFVENGYAANAFSYTDTQTDIIAPERGAKVVGSSLVWMDSGWDPIFSRNLQSGETKQLTESRKTYKEHLSVGGDYAVYLENQRDLVMLNLQTGDAAKLDVKPYPYVDLRTDGRYVTYRDPLENTLYVYDVYTKEVKTVGNGEYASIVDGVIVYLSNSHYNIVLYDVQTAETRILWKSSEGYVVGNSQTIFNGKYIVWTQYTQMAYQTRILDVTDKEALPKVLNNLKELPKNFAFLPTAIDSSVAAWSALDNGKEQIVAVDLSTLQTDIVAENGEQVIGIYEGQLVLRDKANKVLLRSLQSTGQGNVIPETILVSAVPEFDTGKYTNATFGFMGMAPSSKLASSDNSVTVSTNNPRTYSYGSEYVTIYYQRDNDFMLTKALRPGQKFAGHPWELKIGSPDIPLHLSMSYMAKNVPQGEEGKLGIYRLKSGAWVYVGGQLDLKNQRLEMEISDSGVYAVLYHNVPHPSIRDYWQGKVIEKLNAAKPIRVFLDGEELNFHEQPVLKDGSTTVEFRPIFEKLGLQIDWDGATQTVTGTKQGQTLKLTLGHSTAVINGSSSELPTVPFLNQGYTFVPLRFVGEATGRKVLWDPNLKAVYIYDPASEGKLFYDNGALHYEGQLKDGKMNGKGKLYREDGTLWYDAEFRDNAVTGLGTIYYSGWMGNRERTGDITIGPFKNGYPDGYVVSINDNGDLQFEGQEIQGIPQGKGKMYEGDQLLYDGELVNGQPDGYGKYYNNGKLYYEGSFSRGVFHGHGKRFNEDGTLFREGEFENGELKVIK